MRISLIALVSSIAIPAVALPLPMSEKEGTGHVGDSDGPTALGYGSLENVSGGAIPPPADDLTSQSSHSVGAQRSPKNRDHRYPGYLRPKPKETSVVQEGRSRALGSTRTVPPLGSSSGSSVSRHSLDEVTARLKAESQYDYEKFRTHDGFRRKLSSRDGPVISTGPTTEYNSNLNSGDPLRSQTIRAPRFNIGEERSPSFESAYAAPSDSDYDNNNSGKFGSSNK